MAKIHCRRETAQVRCNPDYLHYTIDMQFRVIAHLGAGRYLGFDLAGRNLHPRGVCWVLF